jgi:hypothetical protein
MLRFLLIVTLLKSFFLFHVPSYPTLTLECQSNRQRFRFRLQLPASHGSIAEGFHVHRDLPVPAFVIRPFKYFHYIFEMAPIPPTQRQIPNLAELVGVYT